MLRSAASSSLFQVSIQRVLFALVIVTAAPCAGTADSSLQRLRHLEGTVSANPNNSSGIRELAHAYALALLQADQNVVRYAAAALDTSNNVWILGNAAYMLQCQYNETVQRGSANQRAAALAERYFLRARSLDPKLDRQAILPQIDLRQITRLNETRAQEQREWNRRFEEAAKHIRRLGLEAFPGLPPAIAAVLRARNCTVPQPAGATSPRNVIRGEFFESGQETWAALCSVNGWSTILVFRNGQDAAPHSLARKEDRNYLQSLDKHSVGYSREIRTVGRDFIVGHDNGHPVPKPPRINHHGIDDAFLEKASEVWYFHAGKWYKLPGSD
jgi:hypothetical protein